MSCLQYCLHLAHTVSAILASAMWQAPLTDSPVTHLTLTISTLCVSSWLVHIVCQEGLSDTSTLASLPVLHNASTDDAVGENLIFLENFLHAFPNSFYKCTLSRLLCVSLNLSLTKGSFQQHLFISSNFIYKLWYIFLKC